MYLPLFRGRQYELIALREMVQENLLSHKIVPIIEPVKLSSSLIKTLSKFIETNKEIAIILNPEVGNFLNELYDDNNNQLSDKFFEICQNDNIKLLFYLSSDYDFEKKLKEFSCKEIGVIFKNTDSIPIYEEFFSKINTKYNLIPEQSIFKRKVKEPKILLSDKFNKRDRNNDYLQVEDEPFSDDHLYYSIDGYEGFSDYSIIGNQFNKAGFAPYAVAIHIVYFDTSASLRIRHFVSDSNEDISDQAGKFEEALGKLLEWSEKININTWAINIFRDLNERGAYPGLGSVKKLSIMHHLELMSKYMDGHINVDL